jgi:hypothetical protein
MASLSFFGIGGNNFTGSFPTEFSRLTNLEDLYLGMLFIVLWYKNVLVWDCGYNTAHERTYALAYDWRCFTLLLFLLVSGGTRDMWGNANPVFCDVDTNYTSAHSNFSHLIQIEVPCNVTCNCCDASYLCIDDDNV